MSAENPILVPRTNKENDDPSAMKVDVWRTEADYHALGAADRIIAYEPGREIQSIDPHTGNIEMLPNEQDLGVDTFGPEAQEALARELAQLPLRGDKAYTVHEGAIVEGQVVDYYTVEGMKYGIFDTEDGQRINIFIDNLNPKGQAELAEAHNKKSILEQGHAELNAAEVDEPEGQSQWSHQASLARKEKARQEAEAESAERGGLPKKAWLAGQEVEVQYVSYDADGTQRVTVYDAFDGEYPIVLTSELTFEAPETTPQAAEQSEDEGPETIASLTENLPRGKNDINDLVSYAEATFMLERASGTADMSSIEGIRKGNYKRMSDVAKSRADKYTELVRQQRAPSNEKSAA